MEDEALPTGEGSVLEPLDVVPADDGGDDEARTTSVFGVLGVASGLVLIAGCVLSFFAFRGAPADGEALLERWFEVDQMPFGLEVERASRLAGGEEVVALVRPDAPVDEDLPEAASLAPAEPEDSEDPRDPEGTEDPEDTEPDAADEPPKEKWVDWAAIEELESGTPPARVIVIHYPGRMAEKVQEGQFQSLQWQRIDSIGPQGGRTTLDSGSLDWGEFQARYVVERSYEKGETFRDLLRVSLAVPRRHCVLYALWPRRYPASKERVEELLSQFSPRPSPPAPATSRAGR